MSNRTDVVTHVALSLPSFAQAFSNSSINSISNTGNALPPIQSQSRSASPTLRQRHARTRSRHEQPPYEVLRSNRKRNFRETSSSTPEERSQSPTIQIKEEPDREDVSQPLSPTKSYQTPWLANETPIPSSTKPITTTKRRRVTISGINTDVKRSSSADANTPISPVVMGFTIMKDDPSAIEQVRSMLNVKQQQKALIERRRSSNAEPTGAVSPMTGVPPAVHVVNSTETRHGSVPRRTNQSNSTPQTSSSSSSQQNSSQQESQAHEFPSISHSLPPPPISFAHRRAGRLGSKPKPADIMISPREDQSSEQLQPSIMSAPPVPHTGGHVGRFSMALPTLPPAGQTAPRAIAGVVPPTPTRLSLSKTSAAPVGSQITGRSPPTASVPISSTLVPLTPSSLHRSAPERSAFLAPFEMFYDALSDSKQLKAWLGDQLQKSNAMIATLQKQENIEEVVEALVEKKVVGIRDEVHGLRRRVEELEAALRVAHANQSNAVTKGKSWASTDAQESFTFPPVRAGERVAGKKSEFMKTIASPHTETPGSKTSSPIPYDTGRRLSVSSVRFDPKPGPSSNDRLQNHNMREGVLTIGSSSSKISRSPVNNAVVARPEMRRQHSHPSDAHVSIGPRRMIGPGLTDKYRQVPEDLNAFDGGKQSGLPFPAGMSPRDESWKQESFGLQPLKRHDRSNSSGEGS